MDLATFVELLKVNADAVAAIASFIALGVLSFTQALKVVGIVTSGEGAGRVSLGTAGFLGALVLAGYFLPAFLPVGMVVYSVMLAVSAAANGYEYLAKPLVSRFFPEASISTEDLSG